LIYSIYWLFKSANFLIEYIYVILVITSLFAHYYIIIFSLILISYYQIGELYRKNIKWRRYWRSLPNVVITNYLTGHQLMREWAPEVFLTRSVTITSRLTGIQRVTSHLAIRQVWCTKKPVEVVNATISHLAPTYGYSNSIKLLLSI